MKKILLLNLILICSCVTAQVNDGWSEVGNAAYNSEINSVVFTSDEIGFAVGTGGSFLKTTDGGLTWVSYNTGFDYIFREIVFTNPLTGYIVGSQWWDSEGRVLKTTNGGVTWTEVLTFSERFFDLFFADNNTGFAVGYQAVLKTTDQGQTWTSYTVNGAYDIYSIFFATPQLGYIAANGGCFKTTDGGQVWNKVKEGSFGSVTVTSDNICYLSSNSHSYLFKSFDEGVTWNTTASTGIDFCNKAFIQNALIVYAWSKDDSYSYKIVKSFDGGASWTKVFDNPSYFIQGMARKPDGSFIACGKGGLFMKSNNGNSWDVAQQGLFRGKLNDICFVNNTTAYAVSEAGVIVKTTDQCASWQVLNSGTIEKLWGICATSESTLYAVGNHNTLLKTTNGGQTWVSSNAGYTSNEAHQGEIAFVDENTGYVAMTDVFKTTDAGATWNALSVPFTATGLSLPKSDTIFVSAFSGVQRSCDEGATWTNILPYSSIFWGIDFLNAREGIAAYQNFKVMTTKDAGNTWTNNHFQNKSFRDAHQVDGNILYAIGLKGLIIKSADGGATWNEVQSGTARDLYDITFTPDNTGYILGQDGQILRRVNVTTYTLTFDVMDPGGLVVQNATVTLNGIGYPAGQYVFTGLLPGTYEYSIGKQGFCPSTGYVELTGSYTQPVHLSHCYNVGFEVFNVYDDPVENAVITINSIGNATTNAAGYAAIFAPVIQNAGFSIVATGYKTYTGTITTMSDTIFQIQLDAAIDAPVALEPTSIFSTSFTAKWANAPQTDSVNIFVSDDDFLTYLPGLNGSLVVGTQLLIQNLVLGVTYKYKLRAINHYGISEFSNTISVTTNTNGTFSQAATRGILIIPNPASEIIQLNTKEIPASDIFIIDALGKVVLHEKVDGTLPKSHTINISMLKKGFYIVYIVSAQMQQSGTFVKR